MISVESQRERRCSQLSRWKLRGKDRTNLVWLREPREVLRNLDDLFILAQDASLRRHVRNVLHTEPIAIEKHCSSSPEAEWVYMSV